MKYNKRLSLFAETFKQNKSTFKFNNILSKNFSFKEMEIDIKSTIYEGVLYHEHNKYLTEVNLNMPTKFNALDLKMVKSMLRRVRLWLPFNIDGFSSEGEFTQEKNIPKVALFTGNGKAFCAGGDIVTLYKAKLENPNSKILKDFFRYEYLLDYSITKMNPIQICLWNGPVMGGGVGLSINSPFKVCTDNTVFAMPEGKIGLFTDVGASYFLPRLLNSNQELGLYLGLTGERIKGRDLAVTGVATHYASPETFSKLKDIIIDKVNENVNRESLDYIITQNTEYKYESSKFTYPNLELIKYAFKLDSLKNIIQRLDNIIEDKKECLVEIEAFINSNSRDWAKKCKDNIFSQSPLSLTVILELIKRGTQMNSIDEAFDLEAQVVSGFMEDSDFFEGVRALLVDKDNNPKWKHNHYSEVDFNEVVKKYFDRNEEIDVDPNK